MALKDIAQTEALLRRDLATLQQRRLNMLDQHNQLVQQINNTQAAIDEINGLLVPDATPVTDAA